MLEIHHGLVIRAPSRAQRRELGVSHNVLDFFDRLDMRDNNGCGSGVKNSADMPMCFGWRADHGGDAGVVAGKDELPDGV